jgi:hypothetical protein
MRHRKKATASLAQGSGIRTPAASKFAAQVILAGAKEFAEFEKLSESELQAEVHRAEMRAANLRYHLWQRVRSRMCIAN